MSDEPLIPPIGVIPVEERMFRVNWVASLERSPSGVPLHVPEFVARQGRTVRIVDVRDAEELTGPLGYIPGAHWIPRERALSIAERLPRDTPVIIVSRGGERSSSIAHELERLGMRMVASLRGGMVAWKSLGFGSARDPAILEQRDVLRPVPEVAPAERPLSREAIEKHLGDPQSVRWIKLAAVLLHGKRSCVDGRDDSGVIGTPGGDGGEIVLALAALEQQLGIVIDPATMAKLVVRLVDALGRLYMHTDTHASNELIMSMRKDARLTEAIGTTFEALEWRKWLSSPPEHVREIVISHLLSPGCFGCGHMRLMMQHPESYRVRAELVPDFMRAYMRQRWADTPELELVPLAGGHKEGAVINVRVEGALRSYTPVPLISPAYAGVQMFVNHPQVASYLRRETAALLCEQGDLFAVQPKDTDELVARMEELGSRQLGVTLGHLAPGLPIFDVSFAKSGKVAIERAG